MDSNDKLTSVFGNLLTGKTMKILELMPIMIAATVTNMPETAVAVGAMLLGDLKSAADKDKLLVLVEELIDKKIMEVFDPKNERHQQFLYLAVETVYKCNRRGKIETLVRILNMSIRTNDVSVNDAEDLMNVVTELSVDEAVLLVMVFKMLERKSDNGKLLSSDIHEVAGQETQLHDTKIDFLLRRLTGKGLLQTTYINISDEEDNPDPSVNFLETIPSKMQLSTGENNWYSITSIGRMLMESELEVPAQR